MASSPILPPPGSCPLPLPCTPFPPRLLLPFPPQPILHPFRPSPPPPLPPSTPPWPRPYDLNVFFWAANVNSFRHDPRTYEWMVRTLLATSRLDPLLRLLPSHPCPCADGVSARPHLKLIFRFPLRAFCCAGQLADAAIIVNDARCSLDGHTTDTLYIILLHGFTRWGDHQKALDLFDKNNTQT
ncbi:pentatricopeptide repeat-containing protein At2g36240-like [Phoenix dactylifera]|uniref:Pentatricopeptide repeat-containing protein At2g36240-like n=1 Tax=Phoenix dactylifera TaxID=42345 RepID=A0A8B9AD31_PHODC|nr:pentatricopeptide repeat-containing protein At2g36240-like [Phoenix dactylifera]